MKVFTAVRMVLLCLFFVATAVAQSDARKGVELFGGFTRSRSGVACCTGNANGYHVGVGYAPIRFLLLGTEFSHALGPDPQYVRHLHVGPQFRFTIGGLRPFGRAMAGFSEHRTECPGLPGVLTTRNFSWAVGGGMDLVVHSRVAIRVISLDRIRTEDQWDTRASFGVVLMLY